MFEFKFFMPGVCLRKVSAKLAQLFPWKALGKKYCFAYIKNILRAVLLRNSRASVLWIQGTWNLTGNEGCCPGIMDVVFAIPVKTLWISLWKVCLSTCSVDTSWNLTTDFSEDFISTGLVHPLTTPVCQMDCAHAISTDQMSMLHLRAAGVQQDFFCSASSQLLVTAVALKLIALGLSFLCSQCSPCWRSGKEEEEEETTGLECRGNGVDVGVKIGKRDAGSRIGARSLCQGQEQKRTGRDWGKKISNYKCLLPHRTWTWTQR